MRRLLFSLMVLAFSTLLMAQGYTISGVIYDAQSHETLIGATVMNTLSQNGTTSNNSGFYSFKQSKGEIMLSISYVGYMPIEVSFNLTSDTTLNFYLEGVTELTEVIVSASREKFGVRGSQMSAVEVPVEQLKAIPTLFGESDVLKALQLMPGVQGGSEGSAGFYVRGGGPDENLLLLDGVPLYNVNHMFGFFSVFNPDALKNVTLYKGSFPARFAGRLSSVVDIRMNDGNMREYHGNVSVGLISAKFNVEGPIIKDKLSFNLSARRTYADVLLQPALWIIAKMNDTQGASAGYYFYDLNAKLNYKINERNRLVFSYYMGDDDIYASFTLKEKEEGKVVELEKERLGWHWGNILAALKWQYQLSKSMFMTSTINYTQYRYNLGMAMKYESNSDTESEYQSYKINYKSSIRDVIAKVDFDYSPGPSHDIKYGGNYTFHIFQPDVQQMSLEGNGDNFYTWDIDSLSGNNRVGAHEFNLYFEDNMRLGNVVKLNAGLAYSGFLTEGKYYHALQPRLSARFLVSNNISLKVGYAYMNQYVHLLSNSSISLPTDLWVPATAKVKPMKAHQVSAGAVFEIPKVFDITVEGYYKAMDDIIEYRDGASFWGSVDNWESKICSGRGWAYGFELMLHRTWGKTTGWLAYTWAKSERKFDRPGETINQGRVFPAKYDRRHDFAITVNQKFSEKFDMSASWTISSGNCGTLAMQYYQGLDGELLGSGSGSYEDYVATVGHVERNNYRLSCYHRLDIGFNFHKKYKRHGSGTWNVSVYNAYNAHNPFLSVPTQSYIGHGQYKNVLTEISIFPILPSFSYTYHF